MTHLEMASADVDEATLFADRDDKRVIRCLLSAVSHLTMHILETQEAASRIDVDLSRRIQNVLDNDRRGRHRMIVK